ncbi:MAG: MoaD/ThiS family protein [Synergistetes bacterium]|nr:MoaD/ThiS family protein [Synergistota bacterium]MDW8192416.1 MoaD/ThiS family protein [Synergistota bacterium]
MVKVRFHLYLKKYARAEEREIEVKNGLKIGDLLVNMGVPVDQVGIVTVNGKWQDIDYLLKDGDKVEIFPVYLGG